METIDLTPTDDGFVAIAERFAAQIMSDVIKRRKKDDLMLLDNLIEVVAYLARKDPAKVAQLRKAIGRLA